VLTIAYLYGDYVQMLKPLIAAKNDFFGSSKSPGTRASVWRVKNGLTTTKYISLNIHSSKK
jgi:hypothetical protein